MRSSLKILEFNQIRNKISKYSFSEIATNKLLSLEPTYKYEIVKDNLTKTNQMTSLIAKYQKIPFMENFDNTLIKKGNNLERIYFLDELLFLKLYLKMEQEVTSYIETVDANTNLSSLNTYFKLNDHLKLSSLFNMTFTDYGEIFDDASKELKQVRALIKKLQFDLDNRMQRLLKTYEDYLTEPIIVTRNNRYCLPIKETYKNKVKGVIHDISQSKQTLFIEPEISLQVMAEIEMNRLIEEKEIIKILTNITNIVNSNFASLEENYYKLIELDTIHAKAIYSLEINGIKPKINNQGIIKLIKAKHPLLDPLVAVPISLELDKSNNILLITGPNTGGKTVALKTIGLLTMMIQSGILVPVNEESNLGIFDNVFADIGDDQSIENSLSTFSSHISNIINYLDNLTDNSLILLDELGSGTDPNEGVALAIAIIEEFNKKDVRLVVTSHYSELKTYAYENEGILTASVAFDKDTLKPLYYLQHGISGDSHARLIAKRYGMKHSVINKANELYNSKETDLAKIIKKLNIEKEDIEKERELMDRLKDRYIKQSNELERLKTKLLDEQNKLLEDIRTKEEQKWIKQRKDIEELIQVIELEKKVKEHQIADVKGKLNEKIQKDVIYDKDEVLNLNDKVYIKSYQQYGNIVEIKGNKYRVVFGLFDLWFKQKDLKLVKEENLTTKKTIKKVKQSSSGTNVTKSGMMSLDLRGFRYEEVYDELDKAVDRALLSNLSSLTVIHGFGTGAVREAVYEYLKKSPLIKEYRYGGEGEGLNGATIVTLK